MKTTKMRLPTAAVLGLAACAAPAPAPIAAPTPSETSAATRQAPPPPMESEHVGFPAFHETVLENGLRLIVLEDFDLPVLNVDLYVRSGTADDAPETAGLAAMVAEMLTKGTPERSAQEIASTIEGVGGSLSASASRDHIQASAAVLSDDADLAFALLGDIALQPTFPEDELELLRTRILSSLQAELAEPGPLATRRFMREVYGGDHPYSLAPTPATVRAIERDQVAEFHRRHFRADNAMLVVSGAIAPGEAEALARREFGAWEGGGVPQPSFVDPPARSEARIYFVHRPGSVQSTIHVGHVAIRPDNPDYYPLQVLNKIFGGGTDARLFTILREEKGWTYGAYSQISRPEDVGHFTATAEVRNEVTDSALVEILAQLRRLREEPVSAAELDAAKSFLVGSFPLRIQTPGQIARQVATNRLLGLPGDELTEYRTRISAVTAADVQRVAREYVRPDQAAIVVVGDAARVLESIQGIAPVTLYDVQGEPMDPASLQVRAAAERVDASALEPVTLTYGVVAQGSPVADVTITLARDDEEWVASTSIAGMMSQESEVRFLQDLTPVSARQRTQQGPMTIATELAVADGRLTGRLSLPAQMGGDREVDAEAVPGMLLPEMEAWYLAASDLEPGKSVTVPQFDAMSGGAVNVTYTVTGLESVTVPAGTFDALRVESSGTPQAFVLFLRADAPHILLRQEYAGQPVVLELREIR